MKKLSCTKKLKSLSTYQKCNIFAILVCSFFVCTLTIGYAVLSKNLNINGEVIIRAQKDIRVTDIHNLESISGGYEIYNVKYNTNSVTINAALPNLDSKIIYEATIKNSGTIPMKIKNIITAVDSNDNIKYVLDGIELDSVIDVNSEIKFKIIISYIDPIVNLPTNINEGLNLEFEFVEYIPDSEEKYISNGLILDLRGTDAPINNIWQDRVSNQSMQLNNVSYSNTLKHYTFEGDGYATLGKPIIPAKGDFTLEAMITYPTNMKDALDQAIVSQVDDQVNDTGRFKINAQYYQNQNQLLVFMNDEIGKTNSFITFVKTPTLGSTYIVQVVRRDDKLLIYLEGQLITSYRLDANSSISQQSFKLGKWNAELPQYYTGSIKSVRVYDRFLTEEELKNNSLVDRKKYAIDIEENPLLLKDYAVNHQNGEGLYLDNMNNYVYRGKNPDNYLKFKGSDNLYRIVSYNQDNTMKIVSVNEKINIPFDESGNRNVETDTYCKSSSTLVDDSPDQYYGCNMWNSMNMISNGDSTGTVTTDSTINKYLNTTYYNSLTDNIKNKIISHSFATGIGQYGANRDNININSNSMTWNGNVGLLTLADLLNASESSVVIKEGNTSASNYLTEMGLNYEVFWTMTPANVNTWDIYTISRRGQIGKKRSSRYNQIDGSTTYIMYAKPSFYTKSDTLFSGTGTEDDPFIIK